MAFKKNKEKLERRSKKREKTQKHKEKGKVISSSTRAKSKIIIQCAI